MATQFVTTTLSTTQFIADTQEIFVSATGAILSTGPGIASFDGLANNIDVFVHGTVVASWRGIDLVGTSTGRSGGIGDHSVFVGETGIVQTTATAGIAVNLEGSYNTVSNLGLISSDGSALYFYNGHGHIVQNHGTILSTGDLAIRFLAINSIAQGEGLNFIHNSGLIEGGYTAIESFGAALDVTNSGQIIGARVLGTAGVDAGTAIAASTISNSGLISGMGFSVVLGAGNDRVTNTGTMEGTLALNGGNDTLVNYGRIVGFVDFGNGDDRLVNAGLIDGNVQKLDVSSFTVKNSGTITGDIWMSYGNDRFDGRGGSVLGEVHGFLGDDTFIVDDADTRIVELAGEGTDQVKSSVSFILGLYIENLTLTGVGNTRGIGNDVANTMAGNSGDNLLRGGGAGDVLAGHGGKDQLSGGTGADALKGGAGNDILRGNKGADSLMGGHGNDWLYGGSGDDVLNGGGGMDRLNGGGGSDVFVFSQVAHSAASNKADVIEDFKSGIDRIDLSNLIAGDFAFIGLSGFSGTGAEVGLSPKYPNALVRIDVDGDGVGDMKIVLEGYPSLTELDFIL